MSIRTEDEILEYLSKISKDRTRWFDIAANCLITYLSWDKARQYPHIISINDQARECPSCKKRDVPVDSRYCNQCGFKVTAIEDDWNSRVLKRDREAILKTMREYLPFALEKARYKRALSSMRSIEKFSIWIWLLGDDVGAFGEPEEYGEDWLLKISNHYGFDTQPKESSPNV